MQSVGKVNDTVVQEVALAPDLRFRATVGRAWEYQGVLEASMKPLGQRERQLVSCRSSYELTHWRDW